MIDKKERVIMYASRTLNPVERKYQVYELECLAVVWGVEVFKKYIRNSRTIVRTDCNALQWLKTREHGARVMRWVMRLQEFDLDIQYRKGLNSSMVSLGQLYLHVFVISSVCVCLSVCFWHDRLDVRPELCYYRDLLFFLRDIVE